MTQVAYGQACCTYSAVDVTADYRTTHSNVPVLDHFSYEFQGGRSYVLMGPNGCGKSTLLRVLADEMHARSGAVSFKCRTGKHSWSVEYMPQDYREALFPWKTVRENIYPWHNEGRVQAFSSLDNQQTPSRNLAGTSLVDQALVQFGLGGFADRFSSGLSGGQEQILLLARCTVSTARILLLDEPFSALDVVRRSAISQHLRQEWRGSGKVVISAMHEPDEAVMLADEILVFHGPPLRLAGVVARVSEGVEDTVHYREDVLALIRRVADEGGYDG